MKSCLIVDDSAVIRKIVRQNLESFDFECEEAGDGAIAYDICQKHMPYLILLDWNMPNMTGIQFLKKLRELPHGQDPIVIFCTTENGMDFIQEALTAGATDFIMKPFDREIMQNKLIQNNLIEAN